MDREEMLLWTPVLVRKKMGTAVPTHAGISGPQFLCIASSMDHNPIKLEAKGRSVWVLTMSDEDRLRIVVLERQRNGYGPRTVR